MQQLAFAQSSHIMEPGVEIHTAARIALDASAHVRTLLQEQHTPTATCKQVCTFQSAQSGAYDYYVVFHFFFLSIILKMAGCTT